MLDKVDRDPWPRAFWLFNIIYSRIIYIKNLNYIAKIS
jgi:hypothetical protein